MNSLYGIPIITSALIEQSVPVLQLSHDFKWCSNEFRIKQNKYLKERFGEKMNVLKMFNPVTGMENIVIHPANLVRLKKLFELANGELLI